MRSRNGTCKQRGGGDQDVEALLLHQAADRQQPQRRSGRRRDRAETADVDAVRDDPDVGAVAANDPGHVGVAGDDAGGTAGTRREVRGGDLARVEGVDAEAVRYAEPVGHVRRHLGGNVREVAVDAGDGPSFEVPNDRRGLLRGRARRQDPDTFEQPLGAGMGLRAVAGLGGEDRRQRAARFEREQLVQGERLRPSRKTAHDHDQAGPAPTIRCGGRATALACVGRCLEEHRQRSAPS